MAILLNMEYVLKLIGRHLFIQFIPENSLLADHRDGKSPDHLLGWNVGINTFYVITIEAVYYSSSIIISFIAGAGL